REAPDLVDRREPVGSAVPLEILPGGGGGIGLGVLVVADRSVEPALDHVVTEGIGEHGEGGTRLVAVQDQPLDEARAADDVAGEAAFGVGEGPTAGGLH